jgi:S-adenosylmethionine synthetase
VTFADRRPVRLEALAVQCGTMATVSEDAARSGLEEHVIAPVLQAASIGLEDTTRLIVRPAAGPAGPQAHSGLTGRKSADDAYGSFIRRAGPALSGKAPNRIDRIANYAARHAARAIVEAGLAREIEVQLSYLIGETAPISVEVDSYQSGTIADTSLSARFARDRRLPGQCHRRAHGLVGPASAARRTLLQGSRRLRPHGTGRSENALGRQSSGKRASVTLSAGRHPLTC